jgi:hypothetical protein
MKRLDQMGRVLLVVAIAFLYSSSSLAADQDRYSVGFQYTLVSDHDNGFDGAKPAAWVDKDGALINEIVIIEKTPVNDWLDRTSSTPETGIGVGVVPMFDSHAVFRTGSNHDKSTYVVLGFVSDELIMDEAGTLDSRDDSVFSYGFGVTDSVSNFEYMMSMDQNNYEISAIGMSFISEF